jgi:hypothetical protein
MAMLGCGKGYQPAPPPPPKPAPQASTSTPSASQPAPQPAQQSGLTGGMQGIGAAAGLAPMETAVGGPGAVAPVRPAGNSPPPQPAPTYQPAQVGVGVKGQGYGGGLITTPVSTYFRAQERIEFARIKHDLDLYKAANDNKGPRTHEEFMEKIIKPAAIRLPTLPPGERFVYMPDKEELMVEHPPK